MTSKANSRCPEQGQREGRVFSTVYLREENLAIHYHNELLTSAKAIGTIVTVEL